jgi:phosphoglycerate kinase
MFAKHLASLADIYINDAFSCSHRAHASIFEITKFIPSYAGLQLNLEIGALSKITSEIQRPITCIIGGSKISSKINIIKNLITKFDNIIIVGGMANNILKYKGYEIGKSIQENNCEHIIEEIFSLSKKKGCKVIYPEDVTVGKNLNGSPEIKELNNISKDELILDIGPKTIKTINYLIEKSNTILWNGPAGYFENPSFSVGSIEIAKKIIEKNKYNTIYSVAGGGDTVALLNNMGATSSFNFVSTAGGAFLEYLEGKELPGIKALN